MGDAPSSESSSSSASAEVAASATSETSTSTSSGGSGSGVDTQDDSAEFTIENIIKFRETLRTGIFTKNLKFLLNQPATRGKDVVAASKIFLYQNARCYNTDHEINQSIANFVLLQNTVPDENAKLIDVYSKFALDQTVTRIASMDIVEKKTNADSQILKSLQTALASEEVKRSKVLLAENALLQNEIKRLKEREKEIQDKINLRAAELIETLFQKVPQFKTLIKE